MSTVLLLIHPAGSACIMQVCCVQLTHPPLKVLGPHLPVSCIGGITLNVCKPPGHHLGRHTYTAQGVVQDGGHFTKLSRGRWGPPRLPNWQGVAALSPALRHAWMNYHACLNIDMWCEVVCMLGPSACARRPDTCHTHNQSCCCCGHAACAGLRLLPDSNVLDFAAACWHQ